MKMFYVTRYEHNPDRDTEYYVGGGQWQSMNRQDPVNSRISLRLYENEKLAKHVIQGIAEGDWHEVEIC